MTKPTSKQRYNKSKKEAHKGAKKERKHIKGKTSMLEHKKEQTNMLSSKRGRPRRTNVGLDLVFIVPLYWSTYNTRAIKSIKHVKKLVDMLGKQQNMLETRYRKRYTRKGSKTCYKAR